MINPCIVRPIAWLIAPEEDPRLFSEYGYTVSIDDEAAGEFVVIREHEGHGDRQIRFDAERWPDIQKAVGLAIDEIRQHERESGDE
jgi:hypothetical protein